MRAVARGIRSIWPPIFLPRAVLIGIIGLVLRRLFVQPKDFVFPANVPVQPEVRAGICSRFDAGRRIYSLSCRLPAAVQGNATGAARSGLLSAGEFGIWRRLLPAVAPGGLELLNHFFWWGALGSILLFIPYFPRSKHIHIFLAPINLALKKESPGLCSRWISKRKKSSAPSSWRILPGPDCWIPIACIMCNRCQDVCPATNTGKAFSPAAILINERYELNKILPAFAAGQASPRPLLDFALNDEAAWACTTCNACIEVCPVGNEQMLHIIDVRRERVLTAAEFPKGLQNTFNHMERAGNPFGMSADERLVWAKDLPFPVPTVEQKTDAGGALLGRLRGGLRSARAKDRPQHGRDLQCRRHKLGGAR